MGEPAQRPDVSGRVGAYPWYALFVLFLCYVFNYLDRNILSILAEEVKADLGLDDAQIGFLYGTAFAVFYAVFGIPFGRLADTWVRKNLISIGLFFWSAMTALSGTARSFVTLATYRVGVGVGESSLAPCGYSLIADFFPQRLRATALSIFSSGITLGAGVGFVLGGWIVDAWNHRFPDGSAPFGLEAWQAAFLAVGLPGLVMAVWVWTLREPVKGQQEGAMRREAARPEPLKEFEAVLPPFTLLSLWRAGAGRRGVLINLGAAALFALGAWLVGRLFGDPAQWGALAVGLYAVFSWMQGLRRRDRETFDGIFKSRAFLYTATGFASLSFVTNGFAFWTAPFLLRAHDASPTRVGAMMGIAASLGGFIGMTAGGVISDALKRRRVTGRVDVGILTVVLASPAYVLMLYAPTLTLASVSFFLLIVVAGLWLGPAAAAVNELVPAHIRSTASAVYLLLNLFIGFALGPFAVGKVSDLMASLGRSPADALRIGMLASILFWLFSATMLWRARRLVGPAEAAVQAQAASQSVAGAG